MMIKVMVEVRSVYKMIQGKIQMINHGFRLCFVVCFASLVHGYYEFNLITVNI